MRISTNFHTKSFYIRIYRSADLTTFFFFIFFGAVVDADFYSHTYGTGVVPQGLA